MKKNKLIRACDMAAMIFALSFVIKVVVDLVGYRNQLTSFPIWAFPLAAAMRYLVPAGVLFLVGRFARYAQKIKEEETYAAHGR